MNILTFSSPKGYGKGIGGYLEAFFKLSRKARGHISVRAEHLTRAGRESRKSKTLLHFAAAVRLKLGEE